MYGVWVNAAAVLVGGFLGTLLRGGIKAKYQSILNGALALCVLVIGVSGAIKTNDMMGLIVSVVLGSLLGEFLRIEAGLDAMGLWASRRLAKGEGTFSQGFVSATLLFGVGAMAVVGSLEAGLTGNGDTLMAKSALDFVGAMIFASTLGAGVMLSALPLTLYQGGIALLAGQLAPLLSDALIVELSAVGSVLIIGLSFNMLGVMKERIRVGNMLPAMLVLLAYQPVLRFFAPWFS